MYTTRPWLDFQLRAFFYMKNPVLFLTRVSEMTLSGGAGNAVEAADVTGGDFSLV